ncbi:UNVERIFIED_CONTAM: hypothetical protein FKN15_014968 [Acipenser sinensis]
MVLSTSEQESSPSVAYEQQQQHPESFPVTPSSSPQSPTHQQDRSLDELHKVHHNKFDSTMGDGSIVQGSTETLKWAKEDLLISSCESAQTVCDSGELPPCQNSALVNSPEAASSPSQEDEDTAGGSGEESPLGLESEDRFESAGGEGVRRPDSLKGIHSLQRSQSNFASLGLAFPAQNGSLAIARWPSLSDRGVLPEDWESYAYSPAYDCTFSKPDSTDDRSPTEDCLVLICCGLYDLLRGVLLILPDLMLEDVMDKLIQPEALIVLVNHPSPMIQQGVMKGLIDTYQYYYKILLHCGRVVGNSLTQGDRTLFVTPLRHTDLLDALDGAVVRDLDTDNSNQNHGVYPYRSPTEDCLVLICCGLYDLLRGVLLILPDLMLEDVMDKLIQPEALIVLVNHPSPLIQQGVMKLLDAYFNRAFKEQKEKFLKNHGFSLLANQVYLHQGNQGLLECFLEMLFGRPVGLDEDLNLEDMEKIDPFRKRCIIPILGLIENSLYENTLVHNTLCILLQLVNACSKVADILLDNGLLYVIFNTLAALNGLENGILLNDYKLLVCDIQQLLVAVTIHSCSSSGSQYFCIIEDLITLLGYLQISKNKRTQEMAVTLQFRVLQSAIEFIKTTANQDPQKLTSSVHLPAPQHHAIYQKRKSIAGSIAMKDSIMPRLPRQHFCSYGQIPMPPSFSLLNQESPLPSPTGSSAYVFPTEAGKSGMYFVEDNAADTYDSPCRSSAPFLDDRLPSNPGNELSGHPVQGTLFPLHSTLKVYQERHKGSCCFRAVWYDPASYPTSWQLDPTEGPNRERRRLQRCYLTIPNKYLLRDRQKPEELVKPPLSYLFEDKTHSSFSSTVKDKATSEPIRFTRRCISVAPSRETTGKSGMYFVEDNAADTYDSPVRDDVYRNILTSNLANLLEYGNITALTHLWCSGQITNFEYLTHLNKHAGRSFNDLMQYPVFPFILSDYTNETLDLSEPTIYRNLVKPIAVQSKVKEDRYVDNYKYLEEEFRKGARDDDPMPPVQPYHYGSHYSNSGTVLHFLVRMPPFTKMFLSYQDQSFDIPDRTFHSMNTTWRLSSYESMTDVKELIPEFFYLPEFLVNREGFDFGVRQNSERVNHVNLPPWARNDPRLFILIHRQALESDQVSQTLCQWIDLVFGHKQKGKAAVHAINVFHPATYFGMDVSAVEDPVQRRALETMIKTYGQTPRQLFNAGHMSRPGSRLIMEGELPAAMGLLVQFAFRETREHTKEVVYPRRRKKARRSRSASRGQIDKIWEAVSRQQAILAELLQERSAPPATPPTPPANLQTVAFEVESDMLSIAASKKSPLPWIKGLKWGEYVGSPSSPDPVVCFSQPHGEWFGSLLALPTRAICGLSRKFCLMMIYSKEQGVRSMHSIDIQWSAILSWGYGDNMLRLKSKQSEPPVNFIQCSQLHQVTSCAWVPDSCQLFTGSKCGVITAYRNRFTNTTPSEVEVELEVHLYGHTAEVTNLFVCKPYSILISFSKDGTCIIWDLNRLCYVQSLTGHKSPVTAVSASETTGDISTVCDSVGGGSDLRLWTVNGDLIGHVHCREIICSVAFSNQPEGVSVNVIAGGLENGVVSLTYSCDGHHLYTANSEGTVIAWCRRDQQRMKLPMFYSFLSSYAA